MKAVRSFVAIECPGKIREEIQKLQQELKTALQTVDGPSQINWTCLDNFHLTLKFLGNVAEDRISKIVQAVHGVTEGFSFFTVSVEGIGVFPHARSPRVIWVGAKSVGDDLARLQNDIEKVLGPLGFPPEDRPFHPHLTLGRIKSGDKKSGLGFNKTTLTQWLVENQKRECDRFEAKEVLLMKSDLQASGAVYTPLARMKFGGGGEQR